MIARDLINKFSDSFAAVRDESREEAMLKENLSK